MPGLCLPQLALVVEVLVLVDLALCVRVGMGVEVRVDLGVHFGGGSGGNGRGLNQQVGLRSHCKLWAADGHTVFVQDGTFSLVPVLW